MNDLANQLRDVHLPEAPGMFPLSTLGYGCVLVFLLFIILCCLYGFKKWLKGRARRKALKKIDTYKKDTQIDSVKTIASLSILLRRVALAYYPRHEVAGLTGDEWIKFLNDTSGTKLFNNELKELLLQIPYQKTSDVDYNDLLYAVENWIKHRK
ncbi:MAG: DUF4381 domain-containing protein [Legionellales bacterium]|nr:DUF4381 domain-containing protein [Legionellales bacterium]